ncbi:MAG: signal peptidase I [Firmicutes bacterium]|nr:signal peptidase I [Bacillota bacterium]
MLAKLNLNFNKQRFHRVIKISGNVAMVCLLLFMAAMVFYSVKSRLDGGIPQVAGRHFFVVLSGSMEPAIGTGSLLVVKPTEAEAVQVDDIITYHDGPRTVTHRVMDINSDGSFITKGDANNVPDLEPVAPGDLVGTVTGIVPLAGYVINFGQTRTGMLLLIFLPALAIMALEFRNLYSYATELDNRRKQEQAKGGNDS